MDANARQTPDQNYSFMELREIWKAGTLTLEECMTQVLHILVRLEAKKTQLDFKLLPYKSTEEGLQVWQSYQALKTQAETGELLKVLGEGQNKLYEAMDFILDQFAALELMFIQLEREAEEMINKLDSTSSHLN